MRSRRVSRQESAKNQSANDLLDIAALLDASAAGSISTSSAGGRRARRRAQHANLARSGMVLPLLAAQGCLSVGKDELPLAAAAGDGAAAGGSGGTGSGGGSRSQAVNAGNDVVDAQIDTTLEINASDLLANDVAQNNQALEIVRVFGAVNGDVDLNGAIIQFTPDAGYNGLATFQYEVRDASGNTSIAVVEVNVGSEHHAAADGGDHSGHDGPHAHNPDLIPEHMAVLNLVPIADATHIAVNDGSWFDPNTWAAGEVPGEGAKVHIPEGVTVDYDGESAASIFTVRVDGELDFATDQNTFLEVDTFVVAPTGRLTIGTVDNPVQAGVEAIIQIADNGPIDTNWDPLLFSRGLLSHGAVEIHGAEKDAFLRLAEDPMRGDTSILLESAPEGWSVGDKLVLTGTHLGTVTSDTGSTTPGSTRQVSTEDEELTISRIEGNRIYFEEALQYDHDAPRDDLKAYVANYSRNVQIVTENADDVPVYQRGHVMLLHSNDIDVRYAEFYELGRTDKSERSFDVGDLDAVNYDTNIKARYSLHIHRAGVEDFSDPAHLVGNAVWGSPGWGFVQHDSNAVLTDNAAYDVFGAAFVAETGNETGRWSHNISIKNTGVYGVGRNIENPKDGDDVAAFDLGRQGTGFWFQGRLVNAVDNVAAGSPGGQGFVYFHRGSGQIDVTPESSNREEIFNYGTGGNTQVNIPSIELFDNNEAIGVKAGLLVVKANGNQFHDDRSFITDFTAWEVRTGAHFEYTRHYTVRNLDVISADLVGSSNHAGLVIGNFSRDFVIDGATIDGFRIGVKSGEATDDGVDAELFYIDVNIINQPVFPDRPGAPTSEYEGLSSFDTILTADEFEALRSTGPLHFVSDFEDFSPLSPDGARAELDGVKYDSLGEYEIGRYDPHRYDRDAYQQAIVQEGYWTLPDGTAVTALERYFTDRITGERIKISTFVEVPGGVDEARSLGGVYHGVYDQDNSAPIAVNDTVSAQQNTSIIVDVLANDSDPDGDPLGLDGLSYARHGSVYQNDDGTVTYVPDPNFTGEDHFYYYVEDDNGNLTRGIATVTVEA